MDTKITKGVEVAVEATYQEEFSKPSEDQFVYAYRVIIHNFSNELVQVKGRHLFVTDSSGEKREVIGEGVVGEKPVINSMDYYEYVSACNLKSEIGKIGGYYTVQNLKTKQNFKVAIPEFDLVAPQILN